MGGPPHLLTWNLKLDPIVWIAQVAACCRALAYVDDLLTKVFGLGQLLLSYLTLLAAANLASLSIEKHTCAQVVVTHGREEAQRVLSAFPTGLTPEGKQGFH